MNPKRILVIGATGAMGQYLVPELSAMGYHVDGIAIGDVKSRDPNVRYFNLNGKDRAVIAQFLKNGCEAVVDFMVYGSAERGIRLSGPRPGRPPKERNPELIKLELADNSARNAIEGKFGQCKRRLGMNRVMAKRRDCSETAIAVTILAANLIRWFQEPGWLLVFRFLTSSCRIKTPEEL